MPYPLFYAALGFALGVIALQQSPALPPAWSMSALWLPAALGLWKPALGRWLIPPLAGLLWAWGHAVWQLDQRLSPELEGRDLVVIGEIIGLPEQDTRRSRFYLRLEDAQGASAGSTPSGVVRLNWYRNPPELISGQRWRLQVRLKAPHGFANPGGFDYEGWLFREGVSATGYVRDWPDNQALEPAGLSWDRLRQGLRQQLDEAVNGGVAEALVAALTLGDRSALRQDQWEVLTRTGTNHLIAISGLHVGIVAGLAFFLLRRLWRRWMALTQRLAADRAAALGALVVAAGYAGLAGFAISTQRALVMLAVLFAAVLFRRALRPTAGLSLALGAVLLLDPMASLSPGFWLSFTAVAALAYGMTRRAGRGGIGWRWGRAQWLVAVGLAPLLFLLFGQASLVAPLVNLLAVPLFSLLLLPWVLIGAVLVWLPGWSLPLQAAAWVLGQGYDLLAWLAGQTWVTWALPEKPLWVWGLACLAVLLLLAPRGLPGRLTGWVLLLPLALIEPPPPSPGGFRFTLLDVGQGLAAVLRTRNHVLVYDTGPGFPSGFNTGGAVIAPYLRAKGVGRIDTLVVSHADIDHAGGVSGLLEDVPVDRLLAGEPDEIPMGGARQCLAGMGWNWDGVAFRILHPEPPLPREGNDRSCVLRVSGPGGSLLLTGDAELAVEQALAVRYGDQLRSDILVAGHHGSNTSSSAQLLEQVRPDWVLFSAGYRNRYGFPRAEVLARVRKTGARMADTISGGALAISFKPASGPSEPSAYRQSQPRYWRHRAVVLTAVD